MIATGMGVANSSMRSAAPLASKASIRSWASAAMRGPSFSTWRETKARLIEIAEPRVLGRLHLQDRMALDRVERREMGFGRRPAELLAAHHVQDLPAEAPVAQQRRHVGVRGEAPEAVVLPEEDGRCGADRGVGRVRVVEEGGIARIEADAARRVDDRRAWVEPYQISVRPEYWLQQQFALISVAFRRSFTTSPASHGVPPIGQASRSGSESSSGYASG